MALKEKHTHRLESQATKKSQKNGARLPRTAGLRTISELSESLTKAGLDPSRIEARAEMIAKARSAQMKRKRNEDEEAGMDLDEWEDADDSGNEDGMEVDGDDTTPRKRVKTLSGAAAPAKEKTSSKRQPRSNRLLAGMRDTKVKANIFFVRIIRLLTSFL